MISVVSNSQKHQDSVFTNNDAFYDGMFVEFETIIEASTSPRKTDSIIEIAQVDVNLQM